MKTGFQSHEQQTIHLGRNVQRIREIIGMKQSALASNTGLSQQYISKLEQSDTFADEVLEKLAEGLGVTPELIKKFDEERAVYNIQNNYDSSTNNQNYQPTFNHNPIDKVVELFEKLLLSEKEKVDLLSNVNKAIHDLREQVHAMKQKSGEKG